MRYLVIYDITDDRRLRRIARTLRSYGIRVQKSAFECELSEENALRLFKELRSLAKEGDSILGYRFSAQYGIFEDECEPKVSLSAHIF